MIVPIEQDAALMFTYDSPHDRGCTGDTWFESVSEAVACATEDYGIRPDSWYEADDPPANCQQDWLAPVRVPGREIGEPDFGRLELLTNGNWAEIDPKHPPEVEIDYSVMTRLPRVPP